MFKNMCWEFPAKWLPRWVREERARQSKTIIDLHNRLKMEENRNCPNCSSSLYGRGITQEQFQELSDLMSSKGVAHQAFELLAELRTSEKVAKIRSSDLEKELILSKQERDAVKHSVIGCLEDSLDFGGLKPNSLNYLQCIRKLVLDNKARK